MTQKITIIPEDGTVAIDRVAVTGLDLSSVDPNICCLRSEGDLLVVEYREPVTITRRRSRWVGPGANDYKAGTEKIEVRREKLEPAEAEKRFGAFLDFCRSSHTNALEAEAKAVADAKAEKAARDGV